MGQASQPLQLRKGDTAQVECSLCALRETDDDQAQPILAGLFVLLHEAPTASQLLGVALVIGGIAIATGGGLAASRIRRLGQAKAGV